MLDLQYAEEVPLALRELVEHHARRLGVPLDHLERIGGSLDLAEGFVLAAERGVGLEYAAAPGAPLPVPVVSASALVSGADPCIRA